MICAAHVGPWQSLKAWKQQFPDYKNGSAKLFEPLRTRQKIGNGRNVPLKAARRRDLALVERSGDRSNRNRPLGLDRPQCRKQSSRVVIGSGRLN